MLRFFPPPSSADHERARIYASGALAALALIMALLLITRPPHTDLTPPPLRAGSLLSFRDNLASCRGALTAAGFETRVIPDLDAGSCGYHGAVQLVGGADAASIQSSCALAAGLALWERDVVAPAAQRYFRQGVRADPVGQPYECRRIAGRGDGRWSEHAHANAIDIGGFTLANGRVINVAQAWRAPNADRAFIHEVRDGACRYFQAVLSPDYNRAHAAHLHLDMGRDKLCH